MQTWPFVSSVPSDDQNLYVMFVQMLVGYRVKNTKLEIIFSEYCQTFFLKSLVQNFHKFGKTNILEMMS